MSDSKELKPAISSKKSESGQGGIESALSQIAELVEKSTGHDFSKYKPSTLRRRIERRMQMVRVASVEEYVELLSNSDEEGHQLIDQFLIGVSSFFRDPDDFEALADRVLPELFDNRLPGEPVRIWVPACASGQEAYTIAILCAEYLDGADENQPVQIFASDIDQRSLARARRGIYPRSIADEVSSERLEKFFVETNDGYQVIERLREICLFSVHNVSRDPVFSCLDLISCRNLLIYMNADLQEELLDKFCFALKAEGFLFLGPSETIGNKSKQFRDHDPAHRIFRCEKSVSNLLPEVMRTIDSTSRTFSSRLTTLSTDIYSQAQRFVADGYGPRWVVVDENRRVVCGSGGTENYLTLSKGSFENDIIKMAQNGLRLGLRSALRRAIEEEKKVVRQDLTVETERGIQPVRVSVEPYSRAEASRDLFVVVFEEVGAPLDKRENISSEKGSDEVIAHLEQELSRVHRDLDETVRELEFSNEELRSSNEELLSMNEELQSSNEEMETAKEEVQAANRQLAQTNTDLENLLESTQIATLFLDRQGRIKRMTPAVQAIYNVKPGDIGRPLTDVTHRVEKMPPLPCIEEVDGQSSPDEEVVHTIEGRWYVRRVLPYVDSNAQKQGMVVTFVDNTDRRQAQDRASYLASIVESSADAIVGKTLDGIVTSWNRAAERMYGYSREEMLGSHISRIVPGDRPQEVERIMGRIRVGERIMPFTTKRRCKDGRLIDVSLTVAPVRSADGRLIGASAVARDISERIEHQRLLTERNRVLRETEKKLEEAIVEAEAANESKSEFLANMSHEIRTPMTAILGYADILLTHLEDPDNRQCVETIRRNGKYLLEIINDILDLSKIEAGKLQVNPEPVAPDKMVAEVVSLMSIRARKKSLNLEMEFASKIPETVNTDPVRLRQVLVNLVSNAIKFTDEGRVTVGVELVMGDESELKFSVSDTGIGMTKNEQEELFEPFTQGAQALRTAENTGTGLGLPICQRLVRMLGGEIMVESEPNVGTTVSFTIDAGPLDGVDFIERDTAIERPGQPILTVSEFPGESRILVVDDRREIRMLAAHYFEEVGARVDTASDGREAIGAFSAAMFEGQPYQAIIMDMQMPVMDGYQATKKLRRLGYDVPIIALTAAAMESDRERCLEAGCNFYVAKPIRADELVGLVADCINERSNPVGDSSSPSGPDADSDDGERSNMAAVDESTKDSLRRILVVEDNDDVRDSLEQLLALAGDFEVELAATGAEAIKAAQDEEFDVVLLDLGLPDMSGYRVLEKLQQIEDLESTRFVALTGRGTPEEIERSLKVGFVDHIIKPISIEELQEL